MGSATSCSSAIAGIEATDVIEGDGGARVAGVERGDGHAGINPDETTMIFSPPSPLATSVPRHVFSYVRSIAAIGSSLAPSPYHVEGAQRGLSINRPARAFDDGVSRGG
jgi:hypothetical protein